jgi:hypothetical protein
MAGGEAGACLSSAARENGFRFSRIFTSFRHARCFVQVQVFVFCSFCWFLVIAGVEGRLPCPIVGGKRGECGYGGAAIGGGVL